MASKRWMKYDKRLSKCEKADAEQLKEPNINGDERVNKQLQELMGGHLSTDQKESFGI